MLSMTVNGMASLQAVFTDARSYGARLAQLLSQSQLPLHVQDAWAALLPSMTFSQIQQFEALLRAHIAGEIQHSLEDVLLEMQAQITQHDLSVSGAVHQAHGELDALERQLDALERTGGKRNG